MIRISKNERFERQEKLIEELGLAHVRKSLGYQLSGGERRRCEIARALAVNPNFILLDEPFAGVDPIAVEDIMNIVANLKHKGIGISASDQKHLFTKFFRSERAVKMSTSGEKTCHQLEVSLPALLLLQWAG